MKATNKNKNIANIANIDFTPLDDLMLAVHKAEVRLMDRLLAIWDKHKNTCPKAFRVSFIEYAIGKGYSKKWAGEVIVDAGYKVFDGKNLFRERGEGGGRKKSKTSDKPSGKPSGKVTAKQLAAMAKALDEKGRKELIALLAMM